MPHNFYIEKNGEIEYIESMPYNFALFSTACKAHGFQLSLCTIACNKNQRDLWFAGDVEGKTGGDVASDISKSLDYLASIGSLPGVPDEMNRNWYYGLITDSYGNHLLMDEEMQRCVFTWHLARLKPVFLRYYDDIIVCN